MTDTAVIENFAWETPINGVLPEWIEVFDVDPAARRITLWRDAAAVRTWTERRNGDVVRVIEVETRPSEGVEPHDLEALVLAGEKRTMRLAYGEEVVMRCASSGHWERSELRSGSEPNVVRLRRDPEQPAALLVDVCHAARKVGRTSTFVGSYEPFAPSSR